MKTKLTWFFGLAVIGGVVWYFIHQHQTQAREDHAVVMRQQQTDASIAALTLKYNAVTNWEASLPDRGAGQPYSIDVSRALIQSNGQPVLITMVLADVEEENGSFTAWFVKDDITNGTFKLYVYLKCTQEQANHFLEKTGNDFSKTYAVIARLDEVGRPSLKVSGSGEGEDSNVDIDTSTGIYFAFGKLLEVIRLP
jgi:hypothetical protein